MTLTGIVHPKMKNYHDLLTLMSSRITYFFYMGDRLDLSSSRNDANATKKVSYRKSIWDNMKVMVTLLNNNVINIVI